jgi:RNA polymerase sigma-70 factor (ECF subfamily)
MEEEAVAQLYQQHAPAIYAHCRRLLGSPASARDATQEAFVRVLARGPDRLKGDEALRYLYRVATNVCLNQLREQRVHARAAAALGRRSGVTASSDDEQAARQFATAVLARTDETGAAIAVLHHLDGLSQVEIAETLGITRRTVFNRLRKLKQAAEELLRGSGERGEE